MKQVLIKKGKIFSAKVPDPSLEPGNVLIQVEKSCISIGTEIRGINESGKSLISKAFDKPEKVKTLTNMVKTQGFQYAYNKITEKNYNYSPTGYSISGIVADVGKGVANYSIGDRISAAGAANAYHASRVCVPNNLVVPLKNGVSFSEGSTVAIGSIALHSIRRSQLQIGEYCVVYGAGVLGLIAIQILTKSGVRVAAVDLSSSKLKKADSFGAEITINANEKELIEKVNEWTGGYGADAVLLAVSTNSSIPLSNSFKMCKRKGKVVILGATGLDINRNDIYTKELDLITSTSYGPGRYDRRYEEKGEDYPYDYVRWTENRNMSEYLRLIENNTINVSELISKEFQVDNVDEAFRYISNPENNSLLVVLGYGNKDDPTLPINYPKNFNTNIKDKKIGVGLIGASAFLKDVHLPNLLKLNSKYTIMGICNRTGYKAETLANKYNIYSTSDVNEIVKDSKIELVIITTSHGNHAECVIKALRAGKHVFVEKPLAISNGELELIKNEIASHPNQMLMVGYNRRFSPFIKEIKKHIDNKLNPLIIQYRMNAGFKDQKNIAHDDGGRIIGECCHIIDLCSFLTGSKVESIFSENLSPENDYYSSSDNRLITLKYVDGSVANIQYFATGNKNLSKEYMEIHFDGKSITMDDYKSISGYGLNLNVPKLKRSNKGHQEELIEVYTSFETGVPPISIDSLIETSSVSIQLANM